MTVLNQIASFKVLRTLHIDFHGGHTTVYIPTSDIEGSVLPHSFISICYYSISWW